MSQSRLARVGPVAGVRFVLLLYAGVFVGDTTLFKSLPEPSADASGAERAAYLTGAHQSQLIKGYLVVLAGIFLLVFLRFVAEAVADGSNNSRAANLASPLGSVAAAFTMVGGGTFIPALIAGHGIDPSEAQMLNDVSYAFYIMSWLALSAYLTLLALGSIGNQHVSPSLGWSSLLTAVVMLTMAILFAGHGWVWLLYGVFVLWVVVTSVFNPHRPWSTTSIRPTGSSASNDT